MSFHRLATTNLPSIRIQELSGSFDSGFSPSPGTAIRSQPRDIPSTRGSYPPSDVPPPLPIGPIPEWSIPEGHDRERYDIPKSPGKTWRSPRESRGSFRGDWDPGRHVEVFKEARNVPGRVTKRQSSSFQSEAMSAYDRDILRKLPPIPPPNNQRIPYSPADDRPSSAESDSARLPGWKFAPHSSPIAIESRSRARSHWAIADSRIEPIMTRMALSPVKHPPVFPLSVDHRSTGLDSISVSSLGTGKDSLRDHIRGPGSGPPLGEKSFGDCVRLPLRPRNSYEHMGQLDTMDDVPSSHIAKLTLGSDTPPRPGSYPLLKNNSQRAGSKRRASSPPSEDGGVAQSEFMRKNAYDGSEGHHRRSPIVPHHPPAFYSSCMGSKFHLSAGIHNASAGSSFASSAGTGWHNSLGASSLSSVATNYTIPDCNPPRASFSPPSDADTTSDSPYLSNSPLPSSRRTNRPQDRDVISPQLGSVKLNGPFQCDCCPKKPKRFDKQTDLQAHKMEKQYTCDYCSNRFKNKNEAERHKNSLHLRRHSWSCAALSREEASFYPSTQRPDFDFCGYCGKEFLRDANRELRAEHVRTEHKFGECNQAKKFYRADHFRQHLKHSHSGTAGKWTNFLENACMRDEPNAISEE